MRHLGHACMTFEQVIAHVPGKKKSERTFGQVPLDKATEYAAEDADVTLRLWMVLKPRLAAERMTTVYETLERPLIPVIADMERARHQGRRRDPVAAVRRRLRRASRGSRRRSTASSGTSSTSAHPSQLGELLFDRLKLPGGKRTKTGQWETRAGAAR